ncbi:uncharacterized protein LOC121969311 [Zingiber officinale]|nr:uncharacterized protein LOC121969311 [Zingiber officinale]
MSVLYGSADSKLFLGISSFISLLLSFCKKSSMETDIRSLARRPGGYEEVERTRELVTRDLLGNGEQVVGTAEVDLELRVPDGWERRLDLVTGRTYLHKPEPHPAPRRHHNLDLALPPPSPSDHLPKHEAMAPPSRYQSVCTLDKVRSSLERAGRRPDGSPSPPSSSSTGVSSPVKLQEEGDRELEQPPAEAMVVAGCPACLLYVLVSEAAPRCPRCATHVPVSSEPKKRHKFDLNSPTNEQRLDD